MDIASLSTAMSMERLSNAVGISVMKKIMNQDTQMLQFISDTLEESNNTSSQPLSFNAFDVRA